MRTTQAAVSFEYIGHYRCILIAAALRTSSSFMAVRRPSLPAQFLPLALTDQHRLKLCEGTYHIQQQISHRSMFAGEGEAFFDELDVNTPSSQAKNNPSQIARMRPILSIEWHTRVSPMRSTFSITSSCGSDTPPKDGQVQMLCSKLTTGRSVLDV
jgi:hypothetical protein